MVTFVFVTYDSHCDCCNHDRRFTFIIADDLQHLKKRLLTEKPLLSTIMKNSSAKRKRSGYINSSLSFFDSVEYIVNDPDNIYEAFDKYEGDVLDFVYRGASFSEYYKNVDFLDDLASNYHTSAGTELGFSVLLGTLEEALPRLLAETANVEETTGHFEHSLYVY